MKRMGVIAVFALSLAAPTASGQETAPNAQRKGGITATALPPTPVDESGRPTSDPALLLARAMALEDQVMQGGKPADDALRELPGVYRDLALQHQADAADTEAYLDQMRQARDAAKQQSSGEAFSKRYDEMRTRYQGLRDGVKQRAEESRRRAIENPTSPVYQALAARQFLQLDAAEERLHQMEERVEAAKASEESRRSERDLLDMEIETAGLDVVVSRTMAEEFELAADNAGIRVRVAEARRSSPSHFAMPTVVQRPKLDADQERRFQEWLRQPQQARSSPTHRQNAPDRRTAQAGG